MEESVEDEEKEEIVVEKEPPVTKKRKKTAKKESKTDKKQKVSTSIYPLITRSFSALIYFPSPSLFLLIL